jgi:hypothetical protein
MQKIPRNTLNLAHAEPCPWPARTSSAAHSLLLQFERTWLREKAGDSARIGQLVTELVGSAEERVFDGSFAGI